MINIQNATFLRISGVSGKPHESIDTVVMDLCDALKADITLSEIDRCHRTGKPKVDGPRDILVKFATYRARQKLYTKRTDLRHAHLGYRGTFINEHLTSIRSKQLYAARKLAKDGKIFSAWSTDGNVLIKIAVPGVSAGDKVSTEIKRISTLIYTGANKMIRV
jgi:exosome complex exonuclease DIS3/RRP44